MRQRTGSRAAVPAEDRYYRLDNSAIFIAAITGATGPYVFRFSVELTETVRLPELNRALGALAPRFPFLFVALRRGVFWHYLDPVAARPKVEAELDRPANRFPIRPGRALLRVTAYGRRIACEFHHVVTDGTGALAFIKSLVVEYLVQRGVGADLPAGAFAGIQRPGEGVDPAEEEDSYNRYFQHAVPRPDKMPKAFMMPGRRSVRGYRETVGTLSLPEVAAAAKARRATITEFLAAAQMAALQEIYEGLPPAKRRRALPRISVQIPVNLRKIYPSRTLRNFFLYARASIDLRLGHYDFDEILRRVHHELRLGMEAKELLRQMKRNVGGERHPLGRPVFLPIKSLALRIINAYIAIGAFSGTISNIGQVEMPEPFAAFVKRWSVMPSRTLWIGNGICLVSWKDSIYLTVGSAIRDRRFERVYFRYLAALGLTVSVDSSEPYLDNQGDRP
jgi:hypothetical protein